MDMPRVVKITLFRLRQVYYKYTYIYIYIYIHQGYVNSTDAASLRVTMGWAHNCGQMYYMNLLGADNKGNTYGQIPYKDI